MNHINLLKKNEKKQSSPVSLKVPKWIAPVVLVAVLLPAGIMFGLKFVNKKPASTPSVATPEPSPFKPSTYTSQASIVEEVVKEVNIERTTGTKPRILDIPYNELSFLEKVNYEVLFAKNVFSMFSRVVPAGIGLKSLEVDNFQTLYAVGLGNTADLVSATFIALKGEKVELLPQPFSYITSNDGDGYRFVVTCKLNMGLDLTDPFLASDYMPTRDDLPIITKKVVTLGEADSVIFTGTPMQTNAERIGVYGRFHYNYKGTSTYNYFVKFLLSLHSNKVPCAFKKIDIKALNGSAIAIDAQVIFTVRE
jgi:hypothetical protein